MVAWVHAFNVGSSLRCCFPFMLSSLTACVAPPTSLSAHEQASHTVYRRAVGSARQLALLRPGALYGSNKKMTVTSYKISHEIKNKWNKKLPSAV